jgi:tRNA A37 threonylcarbamoyltransferase TsaD
MMPDRKLSTDNAVMIGITAILRNEKNNTLGDPLGVEASGNLALK